MLIMGNDGGSVNFGYTLLNITPKTLKILEVGQIESTFQNLTELPIYKKPTKAEREKAKKNGKRLTKNDMPFQPPFHERFPVFYNCVNQVFQDYKIDAVIAERFQTRGNGGPLIEIVSMMNAILFTIAHQRNATVKLTPASIWKNAVNKLDNLEDMYKHGALLGFSPHECDSSVMALYLAEQRSVCPLASSLPKWRKALETYAKRCT